MSQRPYLDHLSRADDLVTTYEETRAGFVSLALEKNRRATPFVAEARVLQAAARRVSSPKELLKISDIQSGLLTAAGLSDKALNHLTADDRKEAIDDLIKNFLEPAGERFVEELVFRFLLTRGDTLGGSMRNIGGVLGQRKLARAILASLNIAGTRYRWLHSKANKWVEMSDDDSQIEFTLRGLAWHSGQFPRTLIFNLTVPIVEKNVDLCLIDGTPESVNRSGFSSPALYVAMGELKGGIDPAGADEHWKTARTALQRVHSAFESTGYQPLTFFIGAAIETSMASEIWQQLETGHLTNAANLNRHDQVASVSRWLCML